MPLGRFNWVYAEKIVSSMPLVKREDWEQQYRLNETHFIEWESLGCSKCLLGHWYLIFCLFFLPIHCSSTLLPAWLWPWESNHPILCISSKILQIIRKKINYVRESHYSSWTICINNTFNKHYIHILHNDLWRANSIWNSQFVNNKNPKARDR